MNWGKGMALVMTAFVLFILGMCYFMFTAPVDDYDHQYYEKGLTFNHDYNRQVEVYKDHAVPAISYDGKNLTLTFSQPVTVGGVTMIRPNNSAMDKIYNLSDSAGNRYVIPLKNIAKGRWQLVFDWQASKEGYLYQKAIYLK
ncbi:MAG TPA: FixH family protein [Mucilaginibacter sp.]|jgi:hypothetical protein|nr:FixH family protein [Mucilaginibacter sp.]